MKKSIYIILLLLTLKICNAQNFVPNGDFEQYSNCVSGLFGFDSLLFWFNPTSASPDYYNACANLLSPLVGVPNNLFGYQVAHSGVGYAGIIRWTYAPAHWREYMEVQLLSPLIANQCYHFEMYINLSNDNKITTNATGVYFSDTMVTQFNSWHPLPFIPQINDSTGFLTDTLNWVLVSGTYTAVGGENYMIIGNFKDDATTDTLTVNPSGTGMGYTLVDDVCLTLCGNPCNTIGIQENGNTEIKIYPNPAENVLNIQTNDQESCEIILYDFLSRKLLTQKFTSTITINTSQLSKGIYLYEVRNKNGVIKKGKVVKE